MDLAGVIGKLRDKRPVFHSEADFKFALAWGIQQCYPNADIRLEYPPERDPNKHMDILVSLNSCAFPIELKFKSKKLAVSVGDEKYHLKNHGAQDNGAYDYLKDICRVEEFSDHLINYKCGFVLWLTNGPYYWKKPSHSNAGYAPFSVHDGAIRTRTLEWGENLSAGTIKGREKALVLRNEYRIFWNDYSDLGVRDGVFKYVLLRVK